MEPIHRAIAIVGAGAILPDSPNVAAFWSNIKDGRYSISEFCVIGGTPSSTTILIRLLPTKHIRRSADGSASIRGIR